MPICTGGCTGGYTTGACAGAGAGGVVEEAAAAAMLFI